MKLMRRTMPVLLGACCLLIASAVGAAPSQEEVFKSISDNMGEKSDSGNFLALLMAISAVAILLAVISKRRQRVVLPKQLNHQGKLLKEVLKNTSLRPAEVRLLRSLAESQSLDNPLVLLLCPSVLEKALRQKNGKFERKVATQLAKKAGLVPARAK